LKGKLPGQDSNLDKENQKTAENRRKLLPATTSAVSAPLVARRVAHEGTNPPPAAASADPDLARVLAAWPGLSQALRRAILALVESGESG
jgi:hypothetical protein